MTFIKSAQDMEFLFIYRKNELADMQSTIDLRIVEHFAEQKEKALTLLVKELTTKKS